jgi:hypothetical protein
MMNKRKVRIISLVLLIFLGGLFFVKPSFADIEQDYQHDADLVRLSHLLYWTKIVEEYQQKTGYYPFQSHIQSDDYNVLVRVASHEQVPYFTKKSDKYREDLDNNSNGSFQEISMSDFVKELESKLAREIDEKYDIQKVPTKSIVWYNYFATKNGYLFFVTCITCGVTEISTLLMNGFTPTVNIVSDGMAGKVTKALTRDDMLSHPLFKQWIFQKPYKGEHLMKLEMQYAHDSKSFPNAFVPDNSNAPPNIQEAPLAKLQRRAAQGDARAQFDLGVQYYGIDDIVQSYKWLSLASAQGLHGVDPLIEDMAKKMTPSQLAEAKKWVKDWKPGKE